MNIELPENFKYTVKKRYTAYVKGGILYVPPIAGIWKKIAYNLTYAINGKKKCAYCGCHLTRKTVTIDHMYASNCGGVSIPENLLPVCQYCNSRKGYLNFKQFIIFNEISNTNHRIQFIEEVSRENERIRYEKGFILPEEWITYEYIHWIYPVLPYTFNIKSNNEYKKCMSFISKYGNVPYPLVTDVNNRLLSGNHLYWVARDTGINVIPVIKLKNVKIL